MLKKVAGMYFFYMSHILVCMYVCMYVCMLMLRTALGVALLMIAPAVFAGDAIHCGDAYLEKAGNDGVSGLCNKDPIEASGYDVYCHDGANSCKGKHIQALSVHNECEDGSEDCVYYLD